jgi:nuclear GTP-binding protein
VVRIEKVENPEQYIQAMMEKVKRQHLERTYEISNWKDHHEFLEILGRKGGRLLKHGEIDMDGVAKMVLTGKIPSCLNYTFQAWFEYNGCLSICSLSPFIPTRSSLLLRQLLILNVDFMRGKIPWFTPAPKAESGDPSTGIEGREGRLGEMPKKRKRDDEDVSSATTPLTNPSTSTKNLGGDTVEKDKEEEDDDEFEGFSEDEKLDGALDDDMIPLEELSDSDDSSSNGEEHG